MQTLQNLSWIPTSQVNTRRVAVIPCDSTVDSQFTIYTEGTDINGSPVQATYAIVDNLTNSFTTTIKFGPQSYGVAPFTRRTFPLPDPTPNIEIDITGGVATVTMCESNMGIPDEQNQAASSGGGGGVAEYNPWFNRNGLTPTADEVIYIHFFERAVQYQNNFNGIVGGVGAAGVAPVADAVFNVFKNNGILIGTLTYHTDKTMTAATTGGTSGNFAVGDQLTVVAPHTPDGAIENFSATWAMVAA